MILNSLIYNIKKPGSISKKKLIFMAIGLFATKLWLQSRLDKHRVKHRDIKVIWYGIIALTFLILSGWTILLIKLMDTFIYYFGNTWLSIGLLFTVILLITITGWLILKSFAKRLLKKMAGVLLLEKLIP